MVLVLLCCGELSVNLDDFVREAEERGLELVKKEEGESVKCVCLIGEERGERGERIS